VVNPAAIENKQLALPIIAEDAAYAANFAPFLHPRGSNKTRDSFFDILTGRNPRAGGYKIDHNYAAICSQSGCYCSRNVRNGF